MVENLQPRTPYPVLGEWFRLYLIRNPGAAFSFANNATVVFSVAQCIATIVCVVLIIRARTWWGSLPAALIGAGAAGNLVDRLFRSPGGFQGHVVDFFSFGRFAIFNVADVSITLGVAAYVIFVLFIEPRRQSPRIVPEAAHAAPGATASPDTRHREVQ